MTILERSIPTTISMTVSQYERLLSAARKAGKTFSEFMRDAGEKEAAQVETLPTPTPSN